MPQRTQADGFYKEGFGGGAAAWERRGAFQLHLLRARGLEPSHAVLDAGCGPLRGGVHLIRFLDRGKYVGMDANTGFIDIARGLIAGSAALRDKAPALFHVVDFDIASMADAPIDRILCFSVLNHCSAGDRRRFLLRMPALMARGARILITHARWFDTPALEGTRLRLHASWRTPADFEPAMDMRAWGWHGRQAVFPVIELGER